MYQTVPEMLRQGLIMTALGMGLVFAALALLWGVMQVLTTVLRDRAETISQSGPVAAEAAMTPVEEDALTAERRGVAALVAGAMLANALPLLFEPPAGPAFEHGRMAPSWVTANRAYTLQTWQPPRQRESPPPAANDY